MTEYTVHPAQFGIAVHDLATLRVDNVEASRDRVLMVLDNMPGPERDIVMLNAGAAIYVSGRAVTLADGVGMAREAIESGRAKAKLQELQGFH